MYVGECKRAFRVRINDHVSAYYNNNPTKSHFAKHLLERNHLGDDEVLLHYENKYRRRRALEEIEIACYGLHHAYDLQNRVVHVDELVTKVFSVSPSYKETEL